MNIFNIRDIVRLKDGKREAYYVTYRTLEEGATKYYGVSVRTGMGEWFWEDKLELVQVYNKRIRLD